MLETKIKNEILEGAADQNWEGRRVENEKSLRRALADDLAFLGHLTEVNLLMSATT